MTVNINKKRRRISSKVDHEEEKRQLQQLSINQSVITINNNKKRSRTTSAKYEEEKGTNLSNMFPHEIMLDILSRLPAKSLMRFRSVSKSWNYLIRKDHFFINMHLSRTKLQHEKLIFTAYSLYTLDYNQGSNRLEQLIRPSSRLRQIVYRKPSFIWGICNGLICTGHYKPLYIINPSTSEYRKLPHSNGRPRYSSSSYGFGYNPNTNDYVVVRLTCNKLFFSAVSIYSLRNNSWKKIQNIPYQAPLLCPPGQLVNGSLHWVAHSKLIKFPGDEFDIKENAILAFEITTEKFVVVPCPDDQDGFVDQYQGKLCFYHDKYINKSFDLWVMNEYKVTESWTKVFNIRKPEGITCRFWGHDRRIVLCSTKEDYILMRSNEHLILYDPKRRTRRPILGVSWCGPVNTYVPSIVPLDFN